MRETETTTEENVGEIRRTHSLLGPSRLVSSHCLVLSLSLVVSLFLA